LAIMALMSQNHQRYMGKLAAKRSNDSICTFARDLPAKEHDTWVVRAVYEELSQYCLMPILPADNFEADLKIDGEDLEDIWMEISRRACRSMDGCERNSMYNKVQTVRDLICFVDLQPALPKG
jgi:hypothetical protein